MLRILPVSDSAVLLAKVSREHHAEGGLSSDSILSTCNESNRVSLFVAFRLSSHVGGAGTSR